MGRLELLKHLPKLLKLESGAGLRGQNADQLAEILQSIGMDYREIDPGQRPTVFQTVARAAAQSESRVGLFTIPADEEDGSGPSYIMWVLSPPKTTEKKSVDGPRLLT